MHIEKVNQLIESYLFLFTSSLIGNAGQSRQLLPPLTVKSSISDLESSILLVPNTIPPFVIKTLETVTRMLGLFTDLTDFYKSYNLHPKYEQSSSY